MTILFLKTNATHYKIVNLLLAHGAHVARVYVRVAQKVGAL